MFNIPAFVGRLHFEQAKVSSMLTELALADDR